MNIENKVIFSHSEAETEAAGRRLAQTLPLNTVVFMRGNLGAGKTVFTRGFARGLGIEETVSSPTFAIVQEYSIPRGGRLYHLDLYRIADIHAALAFGVDEFLCDRKAISLVEWPERLGDWLPVEQMVEVEIFHRSESEREIRITAL